MVTFKTEFNSSDVLFESAFGVFQPSKDYNELINRPLINNIEIVGNRTAKDLKLQDEMTSLSNMEIEEMFKDFN